ncbi:dipeptidase [Mangrovibacillus cuniculi]|uniref:Membrane dipeptidase n=1 Tax=Mangrovibacillus cuniculi TaxID=2593652 RepID=A0A7S8HF54_9BACI|nr:dipeptidase [Mangrovibacillus cuniculi]QPC46417.1 membrane dipeptidase [Mangrovibacillus cuniculi]
MKKIIDAHCDVLWKLYEDPTRSFTNSPDLHLTYNQLVSEGAKMQAFALFVDPIVPTHLQYEAVLEMLQLYEKEVLGKHAGMKPILSKKDLQQLSANQIGAMLTVEGCDWIDENLDRLTFLIRKGVKAVGLTWNHVNKLADGAMEPRGAGLTSLGFKVIEHLNKHLILTDVSHLSERAFWDVLTVAEYPIASHSNVATLCPHPRNLKDDQIKAMIDVDGWMGITFVPFFLTKNEKATIQDVLRHVEYVCSLGGENNLGFGSDFDGIKETVVGLSSYKDYSNLINELQKHYSERLVRGFLGENFLKRLPS